MLLSLEKIREKVHAEQTTEDISVPSLGGDIRISRLGAREKMQLGQVFQGYERGKDGKPSQSDLVSFSALLLSKCAIDDGGKLYLDNEEGRALLNRLEPEELLELGNQAAALNKMTEDSADDAKKNLSDAQTSDSPSGCAENSDIPTPITS